MGKEKRGREIVPEVTHPEEPMIDYSLMES